MLNRHATQVKFFYVMLLPLLLIGCSEEIQVTEPVVRPVRSIVVGDAEQIVGRSFPGIARAAQELEVSFRVSGPLVQLPVSVGDSVTTGQLLAQIDPRDFEVNLLSAQGQLERSLAAQERAQSEFDRVQRIMAQDPGATSQRALDTAIAQRDQTRAGVSSLQATVAAAEDRVSDSSVLAPFAGVVVATYVENFEDVRASQAIVRIVNDNRIEMVVDIPETLISLLSAVTDVEVEFDAFSGRVIAAQVSEIGTEASPITRTYPVTLSMDQPDGFRILAGMAGRAIGRVEQQSGLEPVIEIPLSALFTDGSSASFVWVISDDMTVTQVQVQTGDLSDFGILVTSGIESGKRIVTAGVSYLVEGQQVRLFETESE